MPCIALMRPMSVLPSTESQQKANVITLSRRGKITRDVASRETSDMWSSNSITITWQPTRPSPKRTSLPKQHANVNPPKHKRPGNPRSLRPRNSTIWRRRDSESSSSMIVKTVISDCRKLRGLSKSSGISSSKSSWMRSANCKKRVSNVKRNVVRRSKKIGNAEERKLKSRKKNASELSTKLSSTTKSYTRRMKSPTRSRTASSTSTPHFISSLRQRTLWFPTISKTDMVTD